VHEVKRRTDRPNVYVSVILTVMALPSLSRGFIILNVNPELAEILVAVAEPRLYPRIGRISR
jgi:hypothetical protein